MTGLFSPYFPEDNTSEADPGTARAGSLTSLFDTPDTQVSQARLETPKGDRSTLIAAAEMIARHGGMQDARFDATEEGEHGLLGVDDPNKRDIS